jgi:hypothetical protein
MLINPPFCRHCVSVCWLLRGLDELVACLFSCWCSTSTTVSFVSGENEAGKFVMTIQDMRVDTVTALSELIETEDRLGANNYAPLGIVLCRGEGVWVWDIEGKRYLDCLAAYSAVNQGHCHPRIREAMVVQATRLTLTSRAFRNDQLALFYEDLARLTGAHKILPMNSGAEAVETAIKIVRKWGYELRGVPDDKAEIIVCANNFPPRSRRTPWHSSSSRFKVKPALSFRLLVISPKYEVSAQKSRLRWFLMRSRRDLAARASCWPKNMRASTPT